MLSLQANPEVNITLVPSIKTPKGFFHWQTICSVINKSFIHVLFVKKLKKLTVFLLDCWSFQQGTTSACKGHDIESLEEIEENCLRHLEARKQDILEHAFIPRLDLRVIIDFKFNSGLDTSRKRIHYGRHAVRQSLPV